MAVNGVAALLEVARAAAVTQPQPGTGAAVTVDLSIPSIQALLAQNQAALVARCAHSYYSPFSLQLVALVACMHVPSVR